MTSRTLPLAGQARPAGGRRLRALREFVRRPAGAVGSAIVLGLLAVVLLGPALAPYSVAQQEVVNRLQGPSAAHLLGTDQLGRDLLSRLLIGTRIALGTAFPAVLSALVVGLIFGMAAGYLGGWIDQALIILLDSMQAFPALVLALVLIAVLGASSTNTVLVLAVAFMPGYARVARAQVLTTAGKAFVEAERALGAGDLRILLVHILPNIFAPLFILLAMDLPSAIAAEAGLSFLGLGVSPPTPSWGVMLSDGFSRIRSSAWPIVWTSLALAVTTLGFTLFGEALRDTLDPRLAGTLRTK